MEKFIWVAFWTVTLFTCLQANPIPIKESSIDLILNEVSCVSYFKPNIFSPSHFVGCIAAALECVMEELKGTAQEECEDPNARIEETVEFLEIQIQKLNITHASTNRSECDCETWSETPLSEFLKGTKFLLESYNLRNA
uniref:Interleukin n=1 Tax=Seriola lalandi dorsalis TaxID=1841481 RepID=A0A3B4YHS1_SERLL